MFTALQGEIEGNSCRGKGFRRSPECAVTARPAPIAPSLYSARIKRGLTQPKQGQRRTIKTQRRDKRGGIRPWPQKTIRSFYDILDSRHADVPWDVVIL